jgi:hypothetical protein
VKGTLLAGPSPVNCCIYATVVKINSASPEITVVTEITVNELRFREAGSDWSITLAIGFQLAGE